MKKNLVSIPQRLPTLLKHAENALSYTLLLPDITPITSTDRQLWVPSAIIQTYKACHPNLFYMQNYDFFGTANSNIENSAGLYSAFHHYVMVDNSSIENPHFLKGDFFANTILMQCVMSSYDTVIHLLEDTSTTDYTLANKWKFFGYNERKESNCYDTESGIRSSIATAFSKKIRTHMPAFDNNLKRMFLTVDNEAFSSQADLFYRLMDIDARKFCRGLGLYNWDASIFSDNRIMKDHWNLVSDFYNNLTDRLPANSTDRLYYLYRLENIFGFGLGNCMIQNLNWLIAKGRLYPDGINNLKTLAMISQLPNVFSRNLYLQLALEAIHNEHSLKDNFFSKLFKSDSLMYRLETVPFNINDWLKLFEKFCLFFSKLVFPVYQWYFFLTLLATAKAHIAVEKEQLPTLQKLLSDYIEVNQTIIEYPLSGPKNSNLSLIANADSDKIIRPVYISASTAQPGAITDSSAAMSAKYLPDFEKSNKKTTDIAVLLTCFKEACADIQMPLPYFDKSSCINANVGNRLNYDRILGQYISFTVDS